LRGDAQRRSKGSITIASGARANLGRPLADIRLRAREPSAGGRLIGDGVRHREEYREPENQEFRHGSG
jgi:hypothetical protein